MKYITRIFATFVVTLVVLSCTNFAFAAELSKQGKTANVKEFSTITSEVSGEGRNIMPLADTTTIIESYGSVTGTKTYTSKIFYGGQDIYMIVASNAEVLVRFYEIRSANSLVAAYRVPSTNNQGKLFSLGRVNTGIYNVEVEVTNGGHSTYEIGQYK